MTTHPLLHQWTQLEASGCIQNFRVAAGLSQGVHRGWFFADSDAHKWLDAAGRVCASDVQPPSRDVKTLAEDFLALLSRAQARDGYLYTYNQIHFPESRWENLLIEHELYCHGHFIEACLACHEAGLGGGLPLGMARRAADLLVRDFLHTPRLPDGHEEIEIALLRLYEVTAHAPYLDLAAALLERRGRLPRLRFALELLRQNARVERRRRQVEAARRAWDETHPEAPRYVLPPGNPVKAPPGANLRWKLSALSGQYFQMHAPLERQTVPVGHAVRFGYLMAAAARLLRLHAIASPDPREERSTLRAEEEIASPPAASRKDTREGARLAALQRAWERMVTRRMYVTGGLGAVPALEGFGRDDELDPEYAYAETCAALASLFWNWEMALLTGEAKYADLFEWQWYNAARPGLGLDGTTYLYNNPLASRGGITRRPWYAVPCCPSNLLRTMAWLDRYAVHAAGDQVWVHQYVNARPWAIGGHGQLSIVHALPWEGRVRIRLDLPAPAALTLRLRLPSWAGPTSLLLNGEPFETPDLQRSTAFDLRPSTTYDPHFARFLPLSRTWNPGDALDLTFATPIRLLRARPGVRPCRGKVAVTRGPLVYCLESVDNPGVDLFSVRLDPSTLETAFSPTLLGGTQVISARSRDGRPLTFIPYYLWANRGESQMTVWVKM
ncbi:MAG: beta-L-arabinofuranosidase domain-containing protein [Anaerolineales bacterium]